MIILSIILWAIGVFLFSFTLWKALKEDYTRDTIYTFTLLILVFSALGGILGNKIAPEFTLWFVILTNVLLGSLVIKRLEIHFFELIDALVPASLYFLVFGHLGVFLLNLENRTYLGLLPMLIALASLFVFKFLVGRYRRFSWYPSGKVGFAGLATVGVYLLLHSVIKPTLTGLSNQDIIVNAIIGVACALGLGYIIYLRSGRK